MSIRVATSHILAILVAFLSATWVSYAQTDEDVPRWRIALQCCGPAYVIGGMETVLDPVHDADYTKTRWGIATGAAVSYYLTNNVGTGLRLDTSMLGNYTHASIDYNDSFLSGSLEDSINYLYIGPFASYRLFSGDLKNHFYFNGGLGFLDYGRWHIIGNKVTLMEARGYSPGGLIEIGYDRMLSRQFAIGLSLEAMAGYLSSLTIISENSQRKVGIDNQSSRLLLNASMMVGMRFLL